MSTLLTPREVDLLLRYPAGRSLRLAKSGKLPCITLPDGEVRFDRAQIEQLIAPKDHVQSEQREACHA